MTSDLTLVPLHLLQLTLTLSLQLITHTIGLIISNSPLCVLAISVQTTAVCRDYSASSPGTMQRAGRFVAMPSAPVLVTVLLLVVVAGCCFAIDAPAGSRDITPEEFTRTVFRKPTLVKFFAPSAGTHRKRRSLLPPSHSSLC
jgi:hypothetical protein